MEFQVRYLALFSLFPVIDAFGWFWIVTFHKNIQFMQGFLKAPFLVQHFYSNELLDDVICNIAFSADDTTVYS